MSASPVIGTPQFVNVRSVAGSQGATPQWDGFTDGLGNTTTPFTGSAASHIITAGPVTAGPIYISVNGAVFSVPFNQNFNLPDYVTKALDTSVWTFT